MPSFSRINENRLSGNRCSPKPQNPTKNFMNKFRKIIFIHSINKLGCGWFSVGWNTSNAIELNTQVVTVHLNTEETKFTPIGTP